MATKATATKKRVAAKAAPTKKATVVKTSSAKKPQGLAAHLKNATRTGADWRALAAEFIGTFLLAAVVIAGQGQPIFVLFGLAGIILLLGAISGAHVNPAITVAAFVTRRIGWLRALGYIIAQVLGAALAFVVLSAFIAGAAAGDGVLTQAPSLFAAASSDAFAGKELYVLFGELIGATILAFAVANVLAEKRERLSAAFTGGFGIFIALMVAVSAASYVGATAAINPAVAVALQAFSWESAWTFAIYAVAPVIGGVLGFVLHDLLNSKK